MNSGNRVAKILWPWKFSSFLFFSRHTERKRSIRPIVKLCRHAIGWVLRLKPQDDEVLKPQDDEVLKPQDDEMLKPQDDTFVSNDIVQSFFTLRHS